MTNRKAQNQVNVRLTDKEVQFLEKRAEKVIKNKKAKNVGYIRYLLKKDGYETK